MNLMGWLNKCGVIRPRFDGQLKDPEKWQNNLLPSHQFDFIILTTSAGIMGHKEARWKHTGEKILGFFFQGCNIYEQIKCLNGRKKKSRFWFSSCKWSPDKLPGDAETVGLRTLFLSSKGLIRESTNYFCKGPDSKYCSFLCELSDLCCNCSILPVNKSSHRQHATKWVWFCSKKTVCKNQGQTGFGLWAGVCLSLVYYSYNQRTILVMNVSVLVSWAPNSSLTYGNCPFLHIYLPLPTICAVPGAEHPLPRSHNRTLTPVQGGGTTPKGIIHILFYKMLCSRERFPLHRKQSKCHLPELYNLAELGTWLE